MSARVSKKSISWRGAICCLLALPTAAAVTFTVNSPADVADGNPGDGVCETAPGNGVCTLRAAVMEGNHSTGDVVIRFGLSGAITYKLTIPVAGNDDEATGDLNVMRSMTIVGNGPANTIIDGNNADRVLTFRAGPTPTPTAAPSPTLNVSGVTLTNGKKNFTNTDANATGGAAELDYPTTMTNVVVSNSSANANTGAAYGGGIYAGAALTLKNCTIRGNKTTTVTGGISAAGGILGSPVVTNSTISNNTARDFGGGIDGSPILIDSTMSGNTADKGGAIYGAATLINSTISGNSAGDGGGLYANGGQTLSLYNSTVAGNTARKTGTGTGLGGGVFNTQGTVYFQNSMIALNDHKVATSAGFLSTADDVSGTVTSGGYNILSTCDATTNCSFSGGGVTITQPQLGALADNGGATQTRALMPGSPGIDGGNPGGCTDNVGALLSTDQRGYLRSYPATNPCDIGAFELQPAPTGQLGNISTRAFNGTGNNVMIVGFIVGGTGAKQVLVRAIGPTLAQFGVPTVLSDPMLELHDGNGTVIATNDDWQLASNSGSIPQNLRPPDPAESAILITLLPDSYTAIVRGKNNATGNALAEVYDLDNASAIKLTNISTRSFVQTGDSVMIGGVIVNGSGNLVLVRGLGPTLSQFGVTDVLADPVMELHDGNGTLIDSNDNWKDTNQAQIQSTGLAPPKDAEAAILRNLTPGNYTAILKGKNNTTGNALLEVYLRD